MNDVMPFLKEFSIDIVGRGIITMLIVALAGLLIWYISTKIMRR